MAIQATTNDYWWIKAVGGVSAVLFGLAALLWPGLTLFALVALYGAYALIEGAVELVTAIRAMGGHRVWWTHLILGLLGIGAGLAVFFWPGMSTVILLYIIGIWAASFGVMEVVVGFVTGNFVVAIAGVISIVFGLLLFTNPTAGALAFVTVIGVFAIARGIILLVGAITTPAVFTPR